MGKSRVLMMEELVARFRLELYGIEASGRFSLCLADRVYGSNRSMVKTSPCTYLKSMILHE